MYTKKHIQNSVNRQGIRQKDTKDGGRKVKKSSQLGGKNILVMGIGIILFFSLGRFVSIPSPVSNTTINIQYGILGIFSVIYGPLVGMVSGLLGHMLIDISLGAPWWSWIIASAIYGGVVGFSKKRIKIEEGIFGFKEILIFNLFQFAGHVISWILVAPVLDILFYQEPVEKLFAQGLTAAIGNAVSTAIVGTILLSAYAKTRMEENN